MKTENKMKELRAAYSNAKDNYLAAAHKALDSAIDYKED